MTIPEGVRRIDWQPGFGGFGEIVQGTAELDQCILAIVATYPGSAPFFPDFGCDIFSLVDQPLNSAAPRMVTAIKRAVAKYEPRIVVLNVAYQLVPQVNETFPSGVIFSLSYELVGGASRNQTYLFVGGTEDTTPGPVAPQPTIRILSAEDLRFLTTEAGINITI